ncbi:MAG: GAF domain-containing protein [Vicinamibacteria bacterium]|nr:GAF domain-containing protein [Vicinamibacteria bacterium]
MGTAGIAIWGRRQDILTGAFPSGLAIQEAQDFAALKALLDTTSLPLILADIGRIAAEQEALETWLKAEGAHCIVIIGISPSQDTEAAFKRFPFLDDVWTPPISATRMQFRLQRAQESVETKRTLRQIEVNLARKTQELHELNKIGVALSAEREIDNLLDMILAKSREITSADAGSLYLVERKPDSQTEGEDHLRFILAQNDSLAIPFEERLMPLNMRSIAGYVALTGQGVNIEDAYNLPPGTPYTISRSFDEQSGYRTQSMLVVPMRDHHDTVIGVVQLINKKRDARAKLDSHARVCDTVIPFTDVDKELLTSLTSQAAVALENTRLIRDIKKLFDSFVRASVTAIESRDPTTSGHSARVATLTVHLAEKVDGAGTGRFADVRFSKDQIQEIRYASLLHDFGKVGVREKVLIKGKKLYVGEMLLVRQRFAYIQRSMEAEYLRKRLELIQANHTAPEDILELERRHAERQAEVERVLNAILQANEPAVVEEESFRALMDLSTHTFTDIEGNVQPYLTSSELSSLSIRKGSLSERERHEIESHVTHTYRFLAEIPWTGEYRRVPEIAYAHHEKIDGTGYPRKLAAVDIPIQSRMMTIADIFDALVAWDRPYKKAVPIERALRILGEEASQGKLDRDLLALFVEAKVFEKTTAHPGTE